MKENKNILSVPLPDLPELKGLGRTFFEKMLEHKDRIAHVSNY